ncbi:MAG: NAD(P)-dependent oxidoreductase [Verrucomicrobia bacterium]|nr:NAD(P)-dependent oxidoreductase [Verrucomicrobiota bacterium]
MKAPKKLMVTGARGFVASNVIARALGDWEVHALSRGEPLFEHSGLQWHVAASTGEADLARVFQQVMPDVVIHTAAIANIDFCEANPALARKANVEMTTVLAGLCASSGSKLVFCSTDNVFDGERAPYSEDDLPAPVNFYGQTKFEAERIVAHAGKNAVIARLAFVVGFPAFGPCHSFLGKVVEAIKSGQQLCAPQNEFRTPIDVVSASRALLELADGTHVGVFHLAGNDRLNRFELLQEVSRVLGLPLARITTVDPSQVRSRAPRPRDVSLDNHKVRCFLKTPMLGFSEALAMLTREQPCQTG